MQHIKHAHAHANEHKHNPKPKSKKLDIIALKSPFDAFWAKAILGPFMQIIQLLKNIWTENGIQWTTLFEYRKPIF